MVFWKLSLGPGEAEGGIGLLFFAKHGEMYLAASDTAFYAWGN